ncbi:MAG: helix-turn-helix transcriptional regulator [Clostridia bacterium]|nr:helix-turn-helix transcriptional regulator [Clostridia bacterium]
MTYMGTAMSDALSVNEIYTVLRPDITVTWPGRGEAHPFPEIFYLSRGRHWLLIDKKEYALVGGQMVIYAPDSYHEASEKRPIEAEANVLTFDAMSEILPVLYNRVITLTEEQKRVLGAIIDEGVGCFHRRVPGDSVQGMVLNDDVEAHTLWRLKKQIEFFLMDVYRTLIKQETSPVGRLARWDAEFASAVQFLRSHLSDPLTLSAIAAGCSMSVSKLKLLFREKAGCGPIGYLIDLRIEEAKRLIREGEMDFTEIAEVLGFASLHYFSRLFKKITGMTPSAYARLSQ